jgi:hypothetical protein
LVTLNGVETLRATSAGNINANFFMLVPVQGISLKAVIAGGNVGISFPTTVGFGYSVWEQATLGGAWTLVQSIGGDGTVKTVSIPATGNQGFLKVTSP